MTLYENENPPRSIVHGFNDLTVQDEKNGLCTHVYDQPPPPYEEHVGIASNSTPLQAPSIVATQDPATQSSQTSTRPCVIPQISKPFGSPFGSPFSRAYPPSLEFHNISQTDFLAFLDGLNEVFISHPLFQGVSAAGSIMQMFHGTAVVQFVGMGLQATSDLSSAATSYMRTKAYLKACNADLFHPTGLHAAILTTKEMMAKIGHPGERLILPALENSDDLDRDTSSVEPTDNPRARRLNALQGYIAPLDSNVPAVVAPENLLAKMSAWQAQRATSKNEAKEAKRQAKSHTRHDGGRSDERSKDERKLDRKLAKLEKTRDKGDGKQHKERDVKKAQRKYDREEKKIDRKITKRAEKAGKGKGKSKADEREEQQANKIRWLVIAQWQGDEEEEEEETSDDSSMN